MGLLSDAQVEAMAAARAASFTSTCHVVRLTRAQGISGGEAVTRDPSTPVPCRRDPASARSERVVGSRDTGVVAWDVHLPAGTTVTRADELDVDGRLYEVVAVLTPAVPTVVLAVCVEVT